VGLEQQAMASPPGYWTLAAIVGAAALAARKAANTIANRSGPEIQFEESPSGE